MFVTDCSLTCVTAPDVADISIFLCYNRAGAVTPAKVSVILTFVFTPGLIFTIEGKIEIET